MKDDTKSDHAASVTYDQKQITYSQALVVIDHILQTADDNKTCATSLQCLLDLQQHVEAAAALRPRDPKARYEFQLKLKNALDVLVQGLADTVTKGGSKKDCQDLEQIKKRLAKEYSENSAHQTDLLGVIGWAQRKCQDGNRGNRGE